MTKKYTTYTKIDGNYTQTRLSYAEFNELHSNAKILEITQAQFPDTPIITDHKGYLIFATNNIKLCDMIELAYERNAAYVCGQNPDSEYSEFIDGE